MSRMRKSYPDPLKAKVALEALKEEKTIEEIASLYEVPSVLVSRWKKQLKENAFSIFMRKKDSKIKEKDELVDRLYMQLGKLQAEHDWLKKKLGSIE